MAGYNFSNTVRAVLQDAGTLAHDLHSPVVTAEHILLGLLSPESESLSQLQEDLSLDPASLAEIRTLVSRRLAGIPQTDSSLAQSRYTPGAKALIAEAMAEATALGHPAIEKEHLLLAYLHHHTGLAQQELTGLGLSWETFRPWVENRF